MKQYCVKCYGSHEPDVPCYDTTEQMKRDIGIRPPKGAPGSGQLSASTVAIILAAFVAVLLAGGLLYTLIV